ncbi:dTDP-4-dehydrorhamnose 3,5-epimerase [Kosakonia pseudosacchari]|uniref:dTDP-4-dehydrorhamnose 3,5-epimerase n=1 Tax=Kosakonia pseudosacchari TaxID=1646340 RepID=A0ABX4IWI4_9ENTR|nr:dTDP-4-dehydrorhamnose 3,5-epimerase [Kosakonia pseudosacchari]PDO90096.1 dTDP-4-dehydrorhamnose 3,5-epimerase [Kosakonia pseudosacchari]
MLITATELPDVLIFEPKVFKDERGYFYESFNHAKFEAAIGRPVKFVQDNQSKSQQGVIRGLHFQAAPSAQGKLVRCVAGEVFDVAVDIRPGSPTFGQWSGALLSADNCRQLWIPEGFAHGFSTLSKSAIILYKTTDYYNPQAERTILWDDPSLAIDWRVEHPILSEKDKVAPLMQELLENNNGY